MSIAVKDAVIFSRNGRVDMRKSSFPVLSVAEIPNVSSPIPPLCSKGVAGMRRITRTNTSLPAQKAAVRRAARRVPGRKLLRPLHPPQNRLKASLHPPQQPDFSLLLEQKIASRVESFFCAARYFLLERMMRTCRTPSFLLFLADYPDILHHRVQFFHGFLHALLQVDRT